MMNRSILLAAATLAIMAPACVSLDESVGLKGKNQLTFDVSFADMNMYYGTRSAEMISENAAGISLSLNPLDFSFEDYMKTRGALVNTAGSTQNLEVYATALNEFYVSAVDEAGASMIPSGTKVSYTDGEWKTGADYIWEDNKVMTFVAVANIPQGDSVSTNYKFTNTDGYQLTLSYNVPGDARSQRDILMAYYKGDGTGSSIKSGGVAQMLFGHPMTAVEFKLGEVQREITGIKSISIENVYASGSVTQIGSCNYAWKALSTSDTKTVTLNPRQGQETLEVNNLSNLIGEPFVVIPQDFSVLAPVIKVVVGTLTKGDVTLTATLDEGKWETGKINTYTLNVSDERVDVEILETVTGNVKSNVSFKNIGNSKSWIRAAIVANWYDADGNIVAAWKENDASSGTFSGFPGTNWEKGSDGFYYYKEIVSPGSSTSNLFDSYTKKTAAGKNLQMDIIVQSIIYNNSKTYKTIWE